MQHNILDGRDGLFYNFAEFARQYDCIYMLIKVPEGRTLYQAADGVGINIGCSRNGDSFHVIAFNRPDPVIRTARLNAVCL